MSFQFEKNMLNGPSARINRVDNLKNQEFEIEKIKIEKIQRSEKNFYDLRDIEDLAEDIKENGLLHNIVVRKIEDSKYELISGERRYLAHKKLVEDGDKFYTEIACKVVRANDDSAEILLIQANALARELTDAEKLEQVKRLDTLYKRKKENGEKIPGRVQARIAKTLNMSESAVGRAQKINNNLISKLKDKIDEGSLNISSANEFASLDKEKQKIVAEIIEEKEITKEVAKNLKEALNEIDSSNDNTESINNIKKSFVEAQTQIVHTKELDLVDKIKKIDNTVLKLIKDLDKKTVINLNEGINLLNELESNIEKLSLKIKDKQN